jgi:Holliday junction resolvasome RuvABC DNA-binding subunit
VETLFEQGVAGAVIGAIFLGAAWIARRLFAKGGMAEKVVESHIDMVQSIKSSQSTIDSRLCKHMDDEEASVETLKRVGYHACEVASEVAEKLELTPEAALHISAIKTELEKK